MIGIAFIDAPALTSSIARSALPHAPVIEDEARRRLRTRRSRRLALGSRHG
jgi:hypothetical protein